MVYFRDTARFEESVSFCRWVSRVFHSSVGSNLSFEICLSIVVFSSCMLRRVCSRKCLTGTAMSV